MSAPPACPVLVWGEELEPPKTQGMCGTSLQAGRISDVLCLLWTLCKSASGGTASVFAWLILYFLLLLQELAPLQKQSTVWSWGCLQQWPKISFTYPTSMWELWMRKGAPAIPFFPPFFSLSQMLLFAPGLCADADEGSMGYGCSPFLTSLTLRQGSLLHLSECPNL